VRYTAEGLLKTAEDAFVEMFDMVLTQDVGNCTAKADIKIGADVIAADVPLTFLLFLEKQLVDVATLVRKLPVRDLGVVWDEDCPVDDCVQLTTTQVKTKKVEKVRSLAAATEHHPEQVDIATEDVLIGHWTNTKFSGECSNSRVATLLQRVTAMQDAVKLAREEANTEEVDKQEIGEAIFGYLFKE